MNHSYFIFISLLILAGIGVTELFYKEKDNDVMHAIEETIAIESCEVEEEIQFIPNPLPLPKKHIKKNMTYEIELLEQDLDYDIKVSDHDDFDLM